MEANKIPENLESKSESSKTAELVERINSNHEYKIYFDTGYEKLKFLFPPLNELTIEQIYIMLGWGVSVKIPTHNNFPSRFIEVSDCWLSVIFPLESAKYANDPTKILLEYLDSFSVEPDPEKIFEKVKEINKQGGGTKGIRKFEGILKERFGEISIPKLAIDTIIDIWYCGKIIQEKYNITRGSMIDKLESYLTCNKEVGLDKFVELQKEYCSIIDNHFKEMLERRGHLYTDPKRHFAG